MLPTLRKRLKTISDGNKGLQDILRSMQEGTEILSVEPYNGKVHNTKITLRIDKGDNYAIQERYEKRVHFYNRVALNKAIPENAVYPKTTVEDAIEVLNLQYGCDFTLDDVELINGTLVAKEMSLGYYSAAAVQVPATCTPSTLYMQRFNHSLPETLQNGALTIQVVKNNTTVTQVVRPSQFNDAGIAITGGNMIRLFAESQGIGFVDGNGGFGQYQIYNSSIKGGSIVSGPGPIVSGPGPIVSGPSVPNPTTIRIMKTQGEPVETDIFEWLLAGELNLDEEALAEARSLGLSIHSCGTQYWGGL